MHGHGKNFIVLIRSFCNPSRVDGWEDLGLSSSFRAYVNYDGAVFWIPSFQWTTSCSIDLSLFPLDTQVCSVIFMAWLHSFDNQMRFVLAPELASKSPEGMTTPILTGLMAENDQWLLKGSHVQNMYGSLNISQSIGVQFSSISFTIALKRIPVYYVLNILVPCTTVSLISIFIFYLPIQSGEKISFGITVLLSYTILLMMVNDITPKGGIKIPILCECTQICTLHSKFKFYCNNVLFVSLAAYYIIASMLLNGLALISTFMVMHLYHHPSEKAVPQWAQALFLCRHNKVEIISDQQNSSIEDLKDIKDIEPEVKFPKKDWEILTGKLDKIAFAIFFILFVVLTLLYIAYLLNCSSGDSDCENAPQSILEVASQI